MSRSNDMAEMQRWRLKKVVDPIKYMLSVVNSGYGAVRLAEFTHIQNNLVMNTVYSNPNTLLVLASAVPLAYATKSLLIPALFVWGSFMYKLSI